MNITLRVADALSAEMIEKGFYVCSSSRTPTDTYAEVYMARAALAALRDAVEVVARALAASDDAAGQAALSPDAPRHSLSWAATPPEVQAIYLRRAGDVVAALAEGGEA